MGFANFCPERNCMSSIEPEARIISPKNCLVCFFWNCVDDGQYDPRHLLWITVCRKRFGNLEYPVLYIFSGQPFRAHQVLLQNLETKISARLATLFYWPLPSRMIGGPPFPMIIIFAFCEAASSLIALICSY